MIHLVQYGRLAFVGAYEASCDFERGDRVVIRGPRGIELGSVLIPAPSKMPVEGEVLRAVSFEDFANAERNEALGQRILKAAEEAGLPMSFIDIEVSLDGGSAVLHGLPWGDCDASPLFADLSDQFGLAVRLLDLSQAPTVQDPVGCGKPGCGSESGGCTSCGSGGGCSTGSCSKGAVKSPEQLTSYFSDLRHQMEAARLPRTPLV